MHNMCNMIFLALLRYDPGTFRTRSESFTTELYGASQYTMKNDILANMKSDIPGNILMQRWWALCVLKVGYFKVMEFPYFYWKGMEFYGSERA